MKTRWQDWLVLILGAWLLMSPWLLQYVTTLPYLDYTAASWDSLIFGLVIVVIMARVLYIPNKLVTQERLALAVGLWLVVSPSVLGFANVKLATINLISVGLAVALLSGNVLGNYSSGGAEFGEGRLRKRVFELPYRPRHGRGHRL